LVPVSPRSSLRTSRSVFSPSVETVFSSPLTVKVIVAVVLALWLAVAPLVVLVCMASLLELGRDRTRS
jgi:hypothetical protein